MSQLCSVCSHPQLDALTEALQRGVSLRLLEDTYGVSRSALSRHAQGHAPDGVSPPLDAPDPAEASQLPAAPEPTAMAGALPATRLSTCPICLLPDDVFERLDAALGAQGPSQSLAQEHSVSWSQLVGHAQHRASEAMSRQRYAQEEARTLAAAAAAAIPAASQAVLPWEELMHLAVQLHQQIEYAASAPAMVFALRNIGKFLPQLVAAMAQACGQACPVPPGLLRPHFRPGDLPPHDQWQMRGRDEASSL